MDQAALETKWDKLQAKIEAAREHLLTQGSLATRQVRSKKHWMLRYTERLPSGQRVQRAIHIGADPILVGRARELIMHYRALGRLHLIAARMANITGSAANAVRGSREGVARLIR